jgi:methionyl-tRNA formyltransferase
MNSLRIVFMGTPEFAVATLGALVINGFNVVGVVTAPDKPAGRGRKISKPAVKVYAEKLCLPLLQPESLRNPEFIERLKAFDADLFIVVAFRMLPEVIWKLPKKGTINLHASLLPNYRGAAPINHAIINGEKVTGVTTFFIDEKIDTGSILLREKIKISPVENAGDIHDKLMKLGARVVIKTITDISLNRIVAVPQDKLLKPGDLPKSAPKINPEFCVIDWEKDPSQVYNLIRGLSPYPAAKTFLKNDNKTISLKIFDAQPEIVDHDMIPGRIISDGKQFMKIACRKGYMNILSLQLEGKNRMGTEEFLRGFRIDDFPAAVTQKV